VHFEKTDDPEPPLEGDYFLLRGDLNNSRLRFAREKQGRVAFLGGSITVARGWRPQVCQWLEEQFPKTEFDFVNAGISSTDTALGPFRLQDTVFSEGPVDLLFVEFAVNDRCNFRTPTESLRGMEGIVRQARKTNPKIDIVMMHFVDEEKMALLRQGKTPPEIIAHEKVADHYRVTSIDLAREVTDRIDRGEFDWQRFGGLHPSAFGHELYADTIARMFEAAWDEPLAEDAKPEAHKLPEEPLDPFHYGRGRFVSPERAQVAGGWQIDPSWQASGTAATRREFTGVPMLVAKRPGAELTLQFEGTAVGLLIVAGPDVGVLEYQVDAGPKRTADQFTPWSDRLHIPWALMLETELTRGEHVLKLRTASDKNEKSTGHASRIVKFLVN
jgi:lysophospholipase L1-like esterase